MIQPVLVEAILSVVRAVSRGAEGDRAATVLCGARGPRTGSPWTPPGPRSTLRPAGQRTSNLPTSGRVVVAPFGRLTGWHGPHPRYLPADKGAINRPNCPL